MTKEEFEIIVKPLSLLDEEQRIFLKGALLGNFINWEKTNYEMEEKTNLQKLPSRIKYYLLEWKDLNMNEYIKKYGELRLNDLTLDQLHGLFSYATTKDGALLARIAS